MLSPSEDAELSEYFAQIGMGSITGAALERAATYHADGYCNSWSWLPPPSDETKETPEQTLVIHETRGEPTDYIPDEREMRIAGEVQRRLRGAVSIWPQAEIILSAYHGPFGQNLSSRSCGRIASLYGFTEGAQVLRMKIKDGNVHALRHECVLFACQGGVSGDSRELLRVMRHQAQALLEKAWRAYSGLAVKDD